MYISEPKYGGSELRGTFVGQSTVEKETVNSCSILMSVSPASV